MNAIEQAKKTLEKAGYYTGNLWQVSDVQNKFNCTEDKALKVLELTFNEDYINQEINEAITNNGEALKLPPVEDSE